MLSEYDKFKVIRPNPENHVIDCYSMPVIKRITEDELNIEKAIPLNLTNLNCKKNNSNKIVVPFNYDKVLLKYWANPLKYIPKLQTALAVGTPDFSIYKNMNENEIRHNIYMNRWLGCLWQEYGILVIPTLSWADKDTYDICFSGIEAGGVVMISTLGCLSHQKEFIEGYNEMIKRLDPSLIIVCGKIIAGMNGRFVNYDYKDWFNEKVCSFIYQKLFDISPIFKVKEAY